MTKLEKVVKAISDMRDFYIKTRPIRKQIAKKTSVEKKTQVTP
jgi:hypothetical protein